MQAKKKFGQNFITDKNLIKKIVSLLGSGDNHLVIEIGPGKGALTKELVSVFDKVIAIEIDRDLKEYLEIEIKDDNFELIMEDFLNFDLEKLLEISSKKYKKMSLISNTPYYISSEILFKTFENSKHLSKAVFMLQKEVAERVCASVNESKYNNLSISSEFYGKRKYEFTVKKQLFKPIPKVDSAIISIEFYDDYKNQLKDYEQFLQFIKKAFNNKRKTIQNNLINLNYEKSKIAKALEINDISSNFRPENISLNQFLSLFKFLEI